MYSNDILGIPIATMWNHGINNTKLYGNRQISIWIIQISEFLGLQVEWLA
jgi:hypothetical protein